MENIEAYIRSCIQTTRGLRCSTDN